MSTCVCDARSSCAKAGPASSTLFRTAGLVLVVAVIAATSGCTGVRQWFQQDFNVGPDYCQPPAPVADDWIDYEDPAVTGAPTDYSYWWSLFNDPVLDELVDTASLQNLTLQTAGMRILEARARLNIARGNLFPQTQQASGDFTRFNVSAANANSGNLVANDFDMWGTGFNASWELDFWGRFRRAIESEDARLNAEIENYDNVLVILQGEVATAYIQFRTLQERLALSKQNVELQKRTVQIAEVQFRNGKVTGLDVAQGKENLAATESSIPAFESRIRQTGNALCVLLGVPPRDLTHELGEGPIPESPAEILAGIPAELLRRRPDIRRAERLAAAQSAAIGVAESDFYPRIAITGLIGYKSEDWSDLFESPALDGSFGPGFEWNILNYGRIRNNVRVNEAQFYQLVLDYQNTVLTANQEVEDGIVSFLKEKDRVVSLNESASQAQRAVEISSTQYQRGAIDFQPVVYMQQILAKRQDELAASRGTVAANLVSIYKALGGGWQTRADVGMPLDAIATMDEDLVPEPAPLPPVDAPPPVDVAPAVDLAPTVDAAPAVDAAPLEVSLLP